ncbi:PRD domain-containing protein [Clostridium sp. AL.422]|uniref:BglG family transcription antiterminator n=1 Tax=Clostridium TaxID=1485 RepID=UPI00293DEA84|nr:MULTISPECIES: PTS sugar transporter subunit IIA [unclassified Clostridium]MDV4150367.1 PRD domain-containing protein [Clostridium sp. AL.422]
MRELDIINDLIKSSDYLSIDYFIDKYSLSKRTLQNDFSYLTNIMSDKGFRLIQKRGRGYLLEVVNEEKFDKFINVLKRASDRPKISAENIIAYIALNEDYIVIEKLIEVFEVSKSLIKSYKEEEDIYLKKYNLTIERKAHYGIKIINSLIERRNLLVDLYIKNNEIVRRVFDELIESDFKDVQDSLIETLKNMNLNINYTELNQIIVWLKVTIYINLKLNTPIDNCTNMKLVNIIGDKFKVGIGDDIDTLNDLIKSKTRSNNQNKMYLEKLNVDISNFLKKIDIENNTSFNLDEDFKDLLITHIAALINRLNFKISYTNPIIDELSIKYPMIFNVAIALGDMLKENYNIEILRDEIGFIATHFAVHMEKEIIYKLRKYNRIAIVCSSGGGSAYLLKLKISNLFGNSNIETFSMLQMKELEDYSPDIVFSINELSTNLKVPLIYIKELLDDYDILNIKQLLMFEKFNEAFADKTKEYYLKRFFEPNYFSIDDESEDYISCLIKMSKEIEFAGIGGEDYSKYVLKREEFSATIYLNGVAIPHPIEMQGNRDLISVKILKKPIFYKEKKVSIIFMVSLRKDNLEFHKGITNDLFKIMNNLEMVQSLIKVRSFKEFIALFNKNM